LINAENDDLPAAERLLIDAKNDELPAAERLLSLARRFNALSLLKLLHEMRVSNPSPRMRAAA
jgi:hypothetical protein